MAGRTLESRLTSIVNAPKLEPLPVKEKVSLRSEKRYNGRQVTYKFSSVIQPDGTVYPCIVTNMSEQGMKIIMKAHCSLPKVVTISVPELGIKKQMQVVWQDEDEVGLCATV
jgi:hypothetical protein